MLSPPHDLKEGTDVCSCLVLIPQRKKIDLGLAHVLKIMSLVDNFVFVKVLNCGCGQDFVAIFDIVENCSQMRVMRLQLCHFVVADSFLKPWFVYL